MKRKFFTSLAAAGLLACTIVTASATRPTYKPNWVCFYWQCPDTEPEKPTLPETPKPDQTPEQDSNGSTTGSMSQLERQACELINAQRVANGLDPLTIDSNLSVKARIKSADMKQNNYFSHTSPTYGSPFTMMKQLGIAYQSAGENIAAGYRSPEDVVDGWMNSPGHRANILNSGFRKIGVGYVNAPATVYTHYWVQMFAS